MGNLYHILIILLALSILAVLKEEPSATDLHYLFIIIFGAAQVTGHAMAVQP